MTAFYLIAYLLIGLFVMATIQTGFKDSEPMWLVILVWPVVLVVFLFIAIAMAVYWLGTKLGEALAKLGDNI